jgi:hypothetical protein
MKTSCGAAGGLPLRPTSIRRNPSSTADLPPHRGCSHFGRAPDNEGGFLERTDLADALARTAVSLKRTFFGRRKATG